MHAVTISEPGGPDVLTWAEAPDPVPQPGEVVIEVVATAVNRADLLQRQGAYPPPPGAPPYPGLECSGRIVALGDGVEGWQVGDEVCALLAGGGYASLVAVPAGQVLPVPDGVSLTNAAALPEVACTVWSNVFAIGRLQAGDSLLVPGAGSGIGTFAVQLAHAVGATVYGTARAAKHDTLRALGADVLIDYTTTDFAAAVRDATDGRGVDVVLDIGLQGGGAGELNFGALMGKRGCIAANTLRSRPVADKAGIVSAVRDHVWPLIADGKVRPVIDRVLPITAAADAHRVVEANQHVGKVLLTVRS